MTLDLLEMPELEDLTLYQQLVDNKADLNSPDLLPNAGELHAAIAMAKLLDKTDKEVKMVLGSFSGAVSDQPNYLKSLENCLDRDVKFKIIFLGKPNKKSKAYKLLLSKQETGRDINFANASSSFIKKLTHSDGEKHFSVYDNNKFRFEKDTKKYLAFFSFNDDDKAQALNKIFDAEWQSVCHSLPA